MRIFKNTTLILPGGRIVIPVGLAGIVAQATKLDRAVKNGDEFHAIREIEVDEMTGKEIDYANVRHGLKLGDGTFAEIDGATIAAKRAKAKLGSIEIEEFIDAASVDLAAAKGGGYFLQPQRKFPMVAKAMRLLYEGMRAEKVVAVVKFCARDRQARAVIQAHKDGSLRLVPLAWAEQIREPDEEVLAHQSDTVKLNAAEKRAARTLIRECKTGGKAFVSMRDDLIVAVEEEADGIDAAPMVSPGEQPVIAGDVMELLEQSLAELARG